MARKPANKAGEQPETLKAEPETEAAQEAADGSHAADPPPGLHPNAAADAATFTAAALDMAAVQTACIALSDAAQHVRRTAVLAEAATVAALTRSLTAAPDDKAWVLTLEAVQQSMQGATGVFTQMSAAAIQLVKGARQAG